MFVAGPLAAPWRTLLHKRVAFFLWLYLLWTLIRFSFFATLVPPGVDPDDSANPMNVMLALLLYPHVLSRVPPFPGPARAAPPLG